MNQIFQNMTKGQWIVVYDDNGFFFLQCEGMPSPYIAATGNEGDVDDSNLLGAASAVNNTYGKGINPESVEKMKEALNYVFAHVELTHEAAKIIGAALTASKL